MKVYRLPSQKLNLEAAAKQARNINSKIKELPIVSIDNSGVVDLIGIGKIYSPGSDFIIPVYGHCDPGVKNIGSNGRTHGGRGFIK